MSKTVHLVGSSYTRTACGIRGGGKVDVSAVPQAVNCQNCRRVYLAKGKKSKA